MPDDDVRPSFAELYGREPAVRAAAPGRVNLIGEHTDYNQGFVMPIATPQETVVLLAPRADRQVRLYSADLDGAERRAEYRLGEEQRTLGWSDYVAGVTVALRESGRDVTGFDARIESSVPLGVGLSSSAALEVAMLRALNDLHSLGLDPLTIAKLAHRAETGLVGAPVGIMDQMAASLGGTDAALFIDTRTLVFERVPLPAGTSLVVIDSGVAHRHATGGYRTRRAECDEAARLLGVASLRDLPNDLTVALALPAPLDRRVRHVLTENDRVLRARDALRDGDPVTVGRLMNASHDSLRDDFEVSVLPVDRLVALAQAEQGVFGARMTGGGFGGAVVALIDQQAARAAAEHIATAYSGTGPEQATILIR